MVRSCLRFAFEGNHSDDSVGTGLEKAQQEVGRGVQVSQKFLDQSSPTF